MLHFLTSLSIVLYCSLLSCMLALILSKTPAPKSMPAFLQCLPLQCCQYKQPWTTLL